MPLMWEDEHESCLWDEEPPGSISGGEEPPERPEGIGTRNERSLHGFLKRYYEPDTQYHEIPLGPYIADICKDGMVTEIQTRALYRLREKLQGYFSRGVPVRVVLPVVKSQWLVWVDPQSGEVKNRRKSPKKGSVYSAFDEIVSLRELIANPLLTFDVAMVDAEQIRMLDGWGEQCKKRASKIDTVVREVAQIVPLHCAADYRALLPVPLPPSFTVKDFAAAARIPADRARNCCAICRQAGVLSMAGKKGNAHLFVVQADV